MDSIDSDGRTPLGAVLAIPHAGFREDVGYNTVETEFTTLHHPRQTTCLLGATQVLINAVTGLAGVTKLPTDESSTK